jgi:hypothetical protein
VDRWRRVISFLCVKIIVDILKPYLVLYALVLRDSPASHLCPLRAYRATRLSTRTSISVKKFATTADRSSKKVILAPNATVAVVLAVPVVRPAASLCTLLCEEAL